MGSHPILYYTPSSPPNRSVLLVARELGLDLELRLVDLMKNEQHAPEFLKMNPQHTVPTLDDNGKYVWDSNAISTYLIGMYGKSDDHPLYPKDLHTRARIDQRLQFNGGMVFPVVFDLFQPVFREGATGFKDKTIQTTYEIYAFLETFLAVDPYMVGSHLTVADLAIVPAITQIHTQIPIDVVKYPKLTGWIKRLEKLPYYREINTTNIERFCVVLDAVLKRNRSVKL